MLSKRAESHGGGDKTDGRVIQESSRRVFLTPTSCTQGEPERNRYMPGSSLRLDLVTKYSKDRFPSDLIRCNPDDLPTHLTAGQPRLTTELRRLELSINGEGCRDFLSNPCLIGYFRCQNFSAAEAASQQILNVSGKLIGILYGTALNGGFQARRKCIPT